MIELLDVDIYDAYLHENHVEIWWAYWAHRTTWL